MFRARLAQCSRSVASSSSTQSSSLHTSAVLQASFRKRRSRVAEKANIERRQERERLAQANRPHIILGHRPGDEAKWTDCDLAKVIVTEADILAAPMLPAQPLHELPQKPTYANYGVGEQEKELLLDILPALTIQGKALQRSVASEDRRQRFDPVDLQTIEAKEQKKTVIFARLIDLRNANARGIAFENRKRIVAAFSESENPTDTGRPEVQAALLTLRIRNLWEHIKRVKKDISNRRSLRRLVHQRAKILKYLKNLDRDRYERVLARLGLEPESIESELVV